MHFIEYVEWPSANMPAASDPWVIGVTAADEVYGALLRVTRVKTIRGRPVSVRLLAEPSQAAAPAPAPAPGASPSAPPGPNKPPHVLYVSAGSDRVSPGAQPGVLTVGDDVASESPPAWVIGFVRVDDRVRFDVALEAAERAGLKLSSRMLQVAHRVIGPR